MSVFCEWLAYSRAPPTTTTHHTPPTLTTTEWIIINIPDSTAPEAATTTSNNNHHYHSTDNWKKQEQQQRRVTNQNNKHLLDTVTKSSATRTILGKIECGWWCSRFSFLFLCIFVHQFFIDNNNSIAHHHRKLMRQRANCKSLDVSTNHKTTNNHDFSSIIMKNTHT